MRILIRPDRDSWPGLVSRPTRSMAEGIEEVRPIVEAVRRSGDTAVRDFTRKFDGAHLDRFEVPASLIRGAGDSLSEDLKAAIQVAFTNLETFHRAQVESPEQIPTQRGVVCWRRSIPIQSVGLYAPGGTAPLFSTVLHLGVPARIAGCPEIILCTPPDSEGQVHPAMLYAAKLVGITKIFRIGGAQAIAAMAYGTDSIPRVDKILGPGNQYVNAAKQWVAVDGVAVDLPAGPTELAILADETASAEFVAADVLSQAEHGPDSQVFVVATDEKIGRDIKAAVSAQIEDLPRADVARAALDHARIAVVPDPLEAQELINAYAAEHLILAVEDAAAAAESVVHAGSVFVGHLTPEAAGDYASGTNHTLPTGGTARAYSGVSVDSFVRKTTFQEITADGLRDLGPHVAVMAEAEGLDGHARAVTRRLHSLPPSQARRTGEVQRSTSETDIFVRVDLDGSGNGSISTGLGFFDHMLMQIARHGGIDLVIRVRGDLEVDEHHTVEDTAIALGSALKEAMGDKRGIERYGFLLPMDEALAQVALDLGGRSHLEWDVPFARDRVGDVPTEMWPHFFKSFCDAAACNLNIKASGENDHHVIEAVFKGVARSLRDAVRNTGGAIPSTKGTL